MAYKNRGHFALDQLRYRLRNASDTETQSEESREQLIETVARKAFEDFNQAIARDETDWTLWRLTGRLAILLGSKRTARYCLEMALAREGDGSDIQSKILSQMGVEEVLAAAQLRKVSDANRLTASLCVLV